MNKQQMYELINQLAIAKSRQDIDAALKLQHDRMVLECPPLGTRAEGIEENRAALNMFFKAFPDYSVEMSGHAANKTECVFWGTAKMTAIPRWLGFTTNGKQATLPVFLRFTFADNLIASEYFSFDLSELCCQLDISTDEVRNRLFDTQIFRQWYV